MNFASIRPKTKLVALICVMSMLAACSVDGDPSADQATDPTSASVATVVSEQPALDQYFRAAQSTATPFVSDLPAAAFDILGFGRQVEVPVALHAGSTRLDDDVVRSMYLDILSDSTLVDRTSGRTLFVLCADATGHTVDLRAIEETAVPRYEGRPFTWSIKEDPAGSWNSVKFSADFDVPADTVGATASNVLRGVRVNGVYTTLSHTGAQFQSPLLHHGERRDIPGILIFEYDGCD